VNACQIANRSSNPRIEFSTAELIDGRIHRATLWKFKLHYYPIAKPLAFRIADGVG
jgi:hypothetical protein